MVDKNWKDYLYFSKSERIAIYILTAFILLIASLNMFIPKLKSKVKPDFTEFINDIEKFKNGIEKNNEEQHLDFGQYAKASDDFILFEFDPNTATKKEFQKLGLNSFAINNLMKYRTKGGRFTKNEDFGKIYGIDQDLFNRLEPYLKIQTNKDFEKPVERISYQNNVALIDINAATADELLSVKGIGPVLSKRIVEYRESLGGFHNIDQINEIYGIDTSQIDRIKSQLVMHEVKIRTVCINLAEIREMASHPYIRFNLAKAIYNERVKNGPYKRIEDIQIRIPELQNEQFEKLLPYISLWD